MSSQSTPQRRPFSSPEQSPNVASLDRPSRPSPQFDNTSFLNSTTAGGSSGIPRSQSAQATSSQPNSPFITRATGGVVQGSPVSAAPPSTPITSAPRATSAFATQPRPTRSATGGSTGHSLHTSHSFNSTPADQPRASPTRSPPLASAALLSPTNYRQPPVFSMPPVSASKVSQGTSTTQPIHPSTLAWAQGEEDDEDDEDEEQDDGAPQQPPTRLFASSHAQPPFHINQVAKGATPGNERSSPQSFIASPTSSSSSFPPFSPSELVSPAKPGARVFGWSPKHANWDQHHEWDESYEVEPSPTSSPRIPPRTGNGAPPPTRIAMSPKTKSAADSIVPAISWLLILCRKLSQSGAINADQAKALKLQILAGKPSLLSAVDSFIGGRNQEAIILALMEALPEVESDGGANDSDNVYESPRDSESDSGSDDGEKDYRAILGSGRGEGGHKNKGAPSPYKDAAKVPIRFGGVEDAEEDEEEEEEEEQENELMILNALMPLSLPQIESFHGLLRNLGFHLLDVETLHLCTSNLHQDRPVGLTEYTESVKQLRLHSSDPRLLTQILLDLFKALDLHKQGEIPYGELIATLSCFCLASGKTQRLKSIFAALNRSTSDETVTASPMTPKAKEASRLPATQLYGFLFSWSMFIHTLLHRSGRTSVVSIENKDIWHLTNNLYALLDQQFGLTSDEEDQTDSIDQSISYDEFVRWNHSPVWVLDALLEK